MAPGHLGPEPRPNLLGMLPAQLVEAFAHLEGNEHDTSLSLSEARRLLAHVISSGSSDLDLRRPVAKRVLRTIEERFERHRLELLERVADETDGFVKYLFRSPDGSLSEAVRIPLAKPGAYTICLSSQVGCAMACDFCATGRLGLARNLQTWEMVSAFLTVRDDTEGKLTGAVFMGQGEPLHNYDEVIGAARVLSHPCGGRIRQEAITISTVGLVAQIKRYTAEGHRYRLITSLTSAVAERRRSLLPVAGQLELRELVEALKEHQRARGGRVTVAWVLLGGINHDAAEVESLARLFGDTPWMLNLIDVNDARPEGYRRANDEERKAFIAALQHLKIPIVRRYSGGSQRHAACGMLAAERSVET